MVKIGVPIFILFILMLGIAEARVQRYSCMDSDNGIVSQTKGNVSGYFERIAYNNIDYCMNSTTVKEYYCSNNRSNSKDVNCGSGKVCNDGACAISNNTQYNNYCQDSDSGNKPLTFGTVTGSINSVNFTNSDYCTDTGTVTEYYCSGTASVSKVQSCGTDSYSAQYCAGNKSYKNLTDYSCYVGACLSTVIIILQQNNDCLTQTNASNQTGLNQSGFYFTDFESTNDWVASGIGNGKFEIGVPTTFTSSAECTTSCIGTGVAGDHSPIGVNAACTNLNGHMQPLDSSTTNSLTSPVYDFTGKTNVNLELWKFMEIEGNNFDLCYFQYKDSSAAAWKTFETFGVASAIDDSAWNIYNKDIHILADNKNYFQVRFYCTTDDWTEGRGICIDDLKLKWGTGVTNGTNTTNPGNQTNSTNQTNPSNGTVSTGWRVTSYQDLNEAVYKGVKTKVFDDHGISLGYYKADFLQQVGIDGSGQGDSVNNTGKHLHYDYNVDDGKTYYLADSSIGAFGTTLTNWTGNKPSIAINPPLPHGTTVRFVNLGPDAANNVAWVNQLLLNTTFYVDDKFSLGSGDNGKYIDVYVGLQQAYDMNGRPEQIYLNGASVVITLP